MKPWFSFMGLGCALVLLNPPTASAANTNSLVGTWETQWIGPGRDRAICYLTFGSNFTFTGYGISLKSLGPITFASTWDVDSKDRIVSGFTESRADGGVPVTLSVTVTGKKLRGRASAGLRNIRVKGDELTLPPNVNGSNWVGEIRARGNTSFQSYTFTASTNSPGWFDITGGGVGQGGAYTITGALVVTSDRNANGYLVSDFGTGTTTSTWSFAGRFLPSLERATFRGHADTGGDFLIRATKQ